MIGTIPNRIALAGGWIDQPFISKHNPKPPGSMVVVSLQPTFRAMDRSGCASGTRAVAMRIWNGTFPKRPKDQLVRELYQAENEGKADPSGSQDMIGLIYPGITRLGQTGKDCFEAIRLRDIHALGDSMNECMVCWEKLLPYTVVHPTIKVDLKAVLRSYQREFPGAMYSGCGGGYLFVVSEQAIPGAFHVTVRIE